MPMRAAAASRADMKGAPPSPPPGRGGAHSPTTTTTGSESGYVYGFSVPCNIELDAKHERLKSWLASRMDEFVLVRIGVAGVGRTRSESFPYLMKNFAALVTSIRAQDGISIPRGKGADVFDEEAWGDLMFLAYRHGGQDQPCGVHATEELLRSVIGVPMNHEVMSQLVHNRAGAGVTKFILTTRSIFTRVRCTFLEKRKMLQLTDLLAAVPRTSVIETDVLLRFQLQRSSEWVPQKTALRLFPMQSEVAVGLGSDTKSAPVPQPTPEKPSAEAKWEIQMVLIVRKAVPDTDKAVDVVTKGVAIITAATTFRRAFEGATWTKPSSTFAPVWSVYFASGQLQVTADGDEWTPVSPTDTFQTNKANKFARVIYYEQQFLRSFVSPDPLELTKDEVCNPFVGDSLVRFDSGWGLDMECTGLTTSLARLVEEGPNVWPRVFRIDDETLCRDLVRRLCEETRRCCRVDRVVGEVVLAGCGFLMHESTGARSPIILSNSHVLSPPHLLNFTFYEPGSKPLRLLQSLRRSVSSYEPSIADESTLTGILLNEREYSLWSGVKQAAARAAADQKALDRNIAQPSKGPTWLIAMHFRDDDRAVRLSFLRPFSPDGKGRYLTSAGTMDATAAGAPCLRIGMKGAAVHCEVVGVICELIGPDAVVLPLNAPDRLAEHFIANWSAVLADSDSDEPDPHPIRLPVLPSVDAGALSSTMAAAQPLISSRSAPATAPASELGQLKAQ